MYVNFMHFSFVCYAKALLVGGHFFNLFTGMELLVSSGVLFYRVHHFTPCIYPVHAC